MKCTEDQLARTAQGLDESELVAVDKGTWLHRAVLSPYRQLARAAQAHNLELAIASGYRSFARQLAIFNAKASGARAVLDDAGCPVAMHALDDTQKLWAILRFSALPGTSRHHWGCDIDVFDRAAMPAGYQLQLTAAECGSGGVFERLHRWLDTSLPGSGFYRPYQQDLGGVAPEPWHLSYAPVAERYRAALTPEALAATLQASDIALKPVVLANLPAIFKHYVR
jgi:LAS superfamily LD-carboxypeptidase LdcB